ncbi:hypothetical protein BC936DRAFT_148406 [Jimgerdemannia flammicorona]|uniref:Uncharacterized protein n=1 Tax=Jimgerdemannia flammicorona TaxID=994334 RepID=A0A433D342_9FUNG|nr:hypothetical protein BC936DRAFT_148406 [Jimgerdemannia flammicorona]
MKSTTPTNRLVKRIYDHFCSGLEGGTAAYCQVRATLIRLGLPRRGRLIASGKKVVEWLIANLPKCEKGNRDLIRSRNLEHNLWDGAFYDESNIFMENPHPHSGLQDLFKIAKGMRRHLKRVGTSVSGIDLEQCRKLKVVASQVAGNRLYMQAMCCVGNGVFVMWEWADAMLPRSLEDM